MSNSSHNTDDENDSAPHNASLSTISLLIVSLPWLNYSKYFFTDVFENYSKNFEYLSSIGNTIMLKYLNNIFNTYLKKNVFEYLLKYFLKYSL
jgi:hypothetical protein